VFIAIIICNVGPHSENGVAVALLTTHLHFLADCLLESGPMMD